MNRSQNRVSRHRLLFGRKTSTSNNPNDLMHARTLTPSGRLSSTEPVARQSLLEICVSAARSVPSPSTNDVPCAEDFARVYRPDLVRVSRNVRPLPADAADANVDDEPELEDEDGLNEVHESMTRDISSPFYFLRSVENNRDASSHSPTHAHPGENMATSTGASSKMMGSGEVEPETTTDEASRDGTGGDGRRNNAASRSAGLGGSINKWINGVVSSIRRHANGNSRWEVGVFDFGCDGVTALQEVQDLLEREYFGAIVSERYNEVRMRVPLAIHAKLSLANITLYVEHRGDNQSRISIQPNLRDSVVVRYEDFDWFCFDVFRRLLKNRDVVRPYYC